MSHANLVSRFYVSLATHPTNVCWKSRYDKGQGTVRQKRESYCKRSNFPVGTGPLGLLVARDSDDSHWLLGAVAEGLQDGPSMPSDNSIVDGIH